MSPQRAKTYVRLFAVVSLSVLANLLLFQPPLAIHGNASARVDGRGARPDAIRSAAGGAEARAMRAGVVAPKFSPAEEVTETVRSIQRELKELGHYPGQIDGRSSQLTHAAIFAYQQQYGLPITAEPSDALLKTLILGHPDGGPQPVGGPGVAPGTPADKLVLDVRQILTALGYNCGRSDGKLSLELIRAIRAYETDNGLLPATGRITATLVLHLQRKAIASKPHAG
jgi:peptidoglycan hydrolase-like protein with peptidoglycan-binding domain